MVTELKVAAALGFLDSSWDEAEFVDTPIGRACFVDIGDPSDTTRPLVALIDYAPGTVIPPHSHGTDYTSIVVSGEIEITRRLHRAGAVRVVRAGTVYGPLIAGPDGCRVIEVFEDRSRLLATYPKDDELSRQFAAMQDEYLRNQLAALGVTPPE